MLCDAIREHGGSPPILRRYRSTDAEMHHRNGEPAGNRTDQFAWNSSSPFQVIRSTELINPRRPKADRQMPARPADSRKPSLPAAGLLFLVLRRSDMDLGHIAPLVIVGLIVGIFGWGVVRFSAKVGRKRAERPLKK